MERSACNVDFYLLRVKVGSEGQAGERDRPRSDGLLSAGENLQRLLRRAGREILFPRPTLPGTLSHRGGTYKQNAGSFNDECSIDDYCVIKVGVI